MKNKLDKAIKEEQESFKILLELNQDEKVSDLMIILYDEYIKSNKRIAKVALEASKLERDNMKYDYYDLGDEDDPIIFDMGVDKAIEEQHKIIEELLNEKDN